MPKEHIVINSDRTVTIPASVKTIGVQYDHNVETIIFDCPRYWNGLDMSTMRVYINYVLPDGTLGAYLADDVTIDEQDDTIMHFSWTITRNITQLNGSITFLVCVKNVDNEGNETNHWNSAISKKLLLVSEGLECSETVMEDYPDLVSQLLLKIDSAVLDVYRRLDGYVPKTDYSPTAKTDAMTQPVGKDANGKLWTAVNFDQILDPDNYPLSESEAVPTYTTLAIELGGLSRSDGTETERSDAVRTVDYIPVLTGKSYILTNGGGYKVCVLCYDASKNFITNWAVDGEIAYSHKYVNSGTTFNIPNNTAYIRFYSSESSDTSVEYTITNENGNISTIGSRAEFVKQYFRNHGYAIYGENIDNATMHKLVIEALGLDSNTYNIVEIKAPTSDPQESTICLMNSGNGKTQFVDISSMVYDADKPTVEIVCQTRGGKKLPEFSLRYNDGSGAGRVKKFAVKPDAIPVELTAEGLRIRKTNAFDNNGLDDDYITVNFVDLLDEISGKVPKTDYSPAEKTDAMTQPVGKDANGKLWTAPTGGGSSGGSSVAIDETLTLSGAAADAKIVGDEIKSVKYVSVKTDTPDGTYDYTELPVSDGDKLVVFASDTDSPFAGMNQYILEGKNIFPNTNRYLSGTSKNGITFETNGRVTHITGAASANTQNYLMNGEALSFPLPEHIAPGDNIVVRTLSAGTINKYVLLSIYFFDANGTSLLSKNHNVHSRSDVSTNLTVPDGAAYFRLAWNVNPGDVSFVYDMYIATAIYKFGETVTTGNSASGGATDIASFPLPMTQLTYSANIRDYIDMIAADNGSLTYDSLGYVTPEMFGAVGDMYSDDIDYMQQAIDYGAEMHIPVRMNRRYATTKPLNIPSNADVYINAVKYSGSEAAIVIDAKNSYSNIRSIDSNGIGVNITGATVVCSGNELVLGTVSAKSHCIYMDSPAKAVAGNRIEFIKLVSGGDGCNCITAQYEGNADYITENTFIGGQCTNADWAYVGTGGNNKFYSIQVEGNIKGGFCFYKKADCMIIGDRHAESQRDGEYPYIRIISPVIPPTSYANSVSALYYCSSTPLKVNEIDVSGVSPQTTTSEGYISYNTSNGCTGRIECKIIGYGLIGEDNSPTPQSFGSGCLIWANVLIFQGVPEKYYTVTENLDLRTIGENTPAMPTIFEIGCENCEIHLHPTYCFLGVSRFEVIQTETYQATIYDYFTNSVIFDGSQYGAGTFEVSTYINANQARINGEGMVWRVRRIE